MTIKVNLKIFTFIVLIFFLSKKVSSQNNLVYNWSFEDTTNCPINQFQFNSVLNWVNPTTSISAIYHSCNSTVPSNSFGYQYAKTGNSYIAIDVHGGPQFWPNDDRIYIEQLLNDTLMFSKTYCLEFYCSLTDISIYASSRIGALLTDTFLYNNNGWPLYYLPTIENPLGNFISDKNNWIKIFGTFISNGSERYLTIGNFRNDAQTDTLNTGSGTVGYGAYYIDDVSVVEVTPSFAGNDTTYCSLDTAIIGGPSTFAADYTWSVISGNAQIDSVNIANPKVWASSSGASTFVMQKTQCNVVTYDTVSITFSCVGENELLVNSYNLNVYPNPANDIITVLFKNFKSDNTKFELFDALGKLVLIESINSNQKEINLKNICSGIYFYRVSNNNLILKQERLIVQNEK